MASRERTRWENKRATRGSEQRTSCVSGLLFSCWDESTVESRYRRYARPSNLFATTASAHGEAARVSSGMSTRHPTLHVQSDRCTQCERARALYTSADGRARHREGQLGERETFGGHVHLLLEHHGHSRRRIAVPHRLWAATRAPILRAGSAGEGEEAEAPFFSQGHPTVFLFSVPVPAPVPPVPVPAPVPVKRAVTPLWWGCGGSGKM